MAQRWGVLVIFSALGSLPNGPICSGTKRFWEAEPLLLQVSSMLDAVSPSVKEALADKGRDSRPPAQPDRCAGQSLLDLPAPLLREISKNLDICSQRNLFLTNSQLYSEWHLQIQPHDSDWHFLERSLDILVRSKSGGPQNLYATGIRVYSQGASWAEIYYLSDQSAFQLDISRMLSKERQKQGAGRKFYPKLTSKQLWHKLASMPGLSSATLLCKSQLVKVTALPGLQLQLKALAQGLFTLLLAYEGYLVIQLPPVHDNGASSGSDLMIRHESCSNSASWSMDYERCTSNPPALHWDFFPQQVKGVHAVIFSRNTHQDLWNEQDQYDPACCDFDPDETKMSFAYKGNVDVDAWVAEQHERINTWMAVHEAMSEEDFGEMYGY